MRYDLTTPCGLCPFRCDDKSIRFPVGRAKELAEGAYAADFPCHKTATSTENGYVANKDSQHCAGALIMFEKMGKPSQMMRIAERIGMYDRRKLNMGAPVFGSLREMLAANRQSKAHKRYQRVIARSAESSPTPHKEGEKVE